MDAIAAGAEPARSPLTVEVRLEPVATADGTVHVGGTVTAPGRPDQSFSGWLTLLQVLEALVEGDR